MKLPNKIIENAENLTTKDFDELDYAYCGYVKSEGFETLYFLPFDLKNKEILFFEVPNGFCKKYDTQLHTSIRCSAPHILASTLNINDIDKIPSVLFVDEAFTKKCLILMNSSAVKATTNTPEITAFRCDIKKLSTWRNNLRLKLRNKMIEAKRDYLQK